MFQYRIAVPAGFSDELVTLLRNNVSLEGIVPLPFDLRSDDPLSVEADAPMAVFLVHDPDNHSIAAIKSWVDSRADPQLDVRGEEPGAGFSLSFTRHPVEDLTAWAARQTQRTAPR